MSEWFVQLVCRSFLWIENEQGFVLEEVTPFGVRYVGTLGSLAVARGVDYHPPYKVIDSWLESETNHKHYGADFLAVRREPDLSDSVIAGRYGYHKFPYNTPEETEDSVARLGAMWHELTSGENLNDPELWTDFEREGTRRIEALSARRHDPEALVRQAFERGDHEWVTEYYARYDEPLTASDRMRLLISQRKLSTPPPNGD